MVIALCFVELSIVLDCKNGIAEQMKILKMIGEFSFFFAVILHLCVIILHSCKSFKAIRDKVKFRKHV